MLDRECVEVLQRFRLSKLQIRHPGVFVRLFNRLSILRNLHSMYSVSQTTNLLYQCVLAIDPPARLILLGQPHPVLAIVTLAQQKCQILQPTVQQDRRKDSSTGNGRQGDDTCS